MARDYLDYHKPKSKLWLVACIIALAVVAIVSAVVTADIRVTVKGSYDVDVKVGEGTQTIQVFQQIEKNYGA